MSLTSEQERKKPSRRRLAKHKLPKREPIKDYGQQETVLRPNSLEKKSSTDLRELKKVNRPILTVYGVAKLLHCSVDRVHRISSAELPRSLGPGKHNLYLLEDVIALVKRRAKHGNPTAGTLSTQQEDVIDCLVDSVRGRSQKRRTP